ncbi:ribosome-inactivating family protein [Streptomyces sp. 900105755]
MTALITVGPGIDTAKADVPNGQVSAVGTVDLRSTAGDTIGARYGYLIDQIRNAAGHQFRNGVRLTQSNDGGLILAGLGYNDAVVDFWITPQDMYLQAFSRNGVTYFFNDVPDDIRGRIMSHTAAAGDGRSQATLPFGSNYNSMTAAAGRDRGAMPYNYNAITSAVEQLANVNPNNIDRINTARSMMLMIQLFSESARFNLVTQTIRGSLTSGALNPDPGLPNDLQAHENRWAQMSAYMTAVSSNPNHPPLTIVGGSPTGGDLVLNNFNDAAFYVALALSDYDLPQEDQAGHWSHTEL